MLGLRTLVGTGLCSTAFKGIFSGGFFPGGFFPEGFYPDTALRVPVRNVVDIECKMFIWQNISKYWDAELIKLWHFKFELFRPNALCFDQMSAIRLHRDKNINLPAQ